MNPGLLVGATFGLVYVLVNAGGLPGPVAGVLRVAAAVAYTVLVVLVLRAGRPSTPVGAVSPGFTRGYWLVVAGEVAAFVVGNALLSGPLDLPEAVLGWVTTVVGVHFVVLARLWQAPSLAAVGGALTLLGLLGIGLALGGADRETVGVAAGVAPGLLLLAACWWGALDERRSLAA